MGQVAQSFAFVLPAVAESDSLGVVLFEIRREASLDVVEAVLVLLVLLRRRNASEIGKVFYRLRRLV